VSKVHEWLGRLRTLLVFSDHAELWPMVGDRLFRRPRVPIDDIVDAVLALTPWQLAA